MRKLILLVLTALPLLVKAQSNTPQDFEIAAMKKFVASIRHTEKNKLSNMIFYPIKIELNHKKVVIKSRTDFLKYYDKIFTSAFKSELIRDINWENVLYDDADGAWGLATGQIWFNDYGKLGVLCSAINTAW